MRLFIGASVLFLAGLLLGYIPEYLRASKLNDDLRTRDEKISRLNGYERLARLRDLASLLYLEVTRKNYGIATQRATLLFDGMRKNLDATQDAALKSVFENTLAQRDVIIAKLAKADPSVEPQIRDIIDRLHQGVPVQ